VAGTDVQKWQTGRVIQMALAPSLPVGFLSCILTSLVYRPSIFLLFWPLFLLGFTVLFGYISFALTNG
jgi:hypothetical protein